MSGTQQADIDSDAEGYYENSRNSQRKNPIPVGAPKQEIVSPVAAPKPNTSVARKSTTATPLAAKKQANATQVTVANPGSTKKTETKAEKKEASVKPTSSTPSSTIGKRTRASEQASQDAPLVMLDPSEPTSSTRQTPHKKKRLTEGKRSLNMDFGPQEGGTLGDMSFSSSTSVPQSPPTPQGKRNLPRKAAAKKIVVDFDDDEEEHEEAEEDEDNDEEYADETPVETQAKGKEQSKQKEQPPQKPQENSVGESTEEEKMLTSLTAALKAIKDKEQQQQAGKKRRTATRRNNVPGPAPTPTDQPQNLSIQQHHPSQTPQTPSQQYTPHQPQDLYMPRAPAGSYRVDGPSGGQRTVDPSPNVKLYLKDTMTNAAHSADPNRGRPAPPTVPYHVPIVTADALRNQMHQQQGQRQPQHQQMQQQIEKQQMQQQIELKSQLEADQRRQQQAAQQREQQAAQQRLQQRKSLLIPLLQSKPTTPPAPIIPKTECDDDTLIEPELPKYYNSYGAEVILPDGKGNDYKTWTKYDLANWVQKFLTSETGQKCAAIIIKEEYDGSLMENLLDDTTKEGLGLTHGAFMKLKNHVAAVLNTHNKTKYLQKKRVFDSKKSLIHK